MPPNNLIPSRNLLASFRRAEHFVTSPIARSPTTTTFNCSRNQQPSFPKLPNGFPKRLFSEGMPRRVYKTVQEQKSRYRSGPFSWRAGLLFLTTGAGLIFYFRYEKERMARQRIAEMTKGVGKPKVGGPFQLVDHNGRHVTEEDFKGKYSLVYFGFSHCPDICPDELDKIASIYNLHNASYPNTLIPLFITCDPARDTPAVLKSYLSEFHPALLGLTGTYEQIKAACKAYRVYFSTPEGVKPGQDYLVDHSIYFYIMDPEGDFVEAIGRQQGPEEAAGIIGKYVGDWSGVLRE